VIDSLPTPDWTDGEGRVALYRGDSLSLMREIPDNSIDLIATDPPYFKVKNEAWDRQWDWPEAFLAWIGELCAEWQRILKPNGSLYCFASPRMAARVEVEIGRRFEVLNHIVWEKQEDNGKRRHAAQVLDGPGARSYYPATERIIFAEHFGADNMAKGEAGYAAKCDELRGFVFEPLRAYLAGERDKAGYTTGSVDAQWQTERNSKGCMAGHWFGVSQWELPTAENYSWLQRLFNTKSNGDGAQYLRREYEDLRREYEDLRREYEDLRRPFAVSADVPYTDVWTFKTVGAYPGKHPCEKPLDLMEHIVRASSRPGAVVLDCFGGSFQTGVAALRLGRRAVVMEKEDGYFRRGVGRIADALSLPAPEPEPDATDADAYPLLEGLDA